jgi:predicted nuclease of restriction endonuclease-like (RecB) superfamily
MAEIMVFEKKYGKRRRSNMNHSQKTEILTKEDVAIERLCADTVALVKHARNIAVQQVNMIQLLTYYTIGKWIIEVQQKGETRARYGSQVIKRLSEEMKKNFERGFSEDSLKNARKFYLTYKDRIDETVLNLFAVEKSETVFSLFEEKPPFIVSWSHYLQLMRIENEDERSFYEIESAKSGWSIRTLQRQYNSSLYERLALSRDKEAVLQLAKKGNIITKPEDIVKQPTVLEFLGMEEKTRYSETDLETAIIDKLQKFLLEMGKGYLFESRQKRFTFNEDNYYVDLVFYNRLLRCYVLIDLKVEKLTHQDIGQMQMYVNYYDRYEKLEDENPTIGILLCKENNDALVEITLPQDANIYASEYKLYLPDKKLLQDKLRQWIEEADIE